MTDWEIHEQALVYFLAEAPDLLLTIEQEILSLPLERTTAKVHNLMRSLHTLKGAAANVEIEMMKVIAHKLEDVVKIFYHEEVEIDTEIQDLLLSGCSILQGYVSCIEQNSPVDDDRMGEQFTVIIDRLQYKLADWWDVEVELPSSVELGFDFVASIFETNIPENIVALQQAIDTQDAKTIRQCLQAKLELSIGLAESVELPGFLAVCTALNTAIDLHPERILEIAQLAIVQWQNSIDLVLAGDRTEGGKLTPALSALIKEQAISVQAAPAPITPPPATNLEDFIAFLSSSSFRSRHPIDTHTQELFGKAIELCWDWFAQSLGLTSAQLTLDLLITDDGIADLDYTEHWIDVMLYQLQTPGTRFSLRLYQRSLILQVVFAVAKFLASTGVAYINPAFLADLRSILQHAVNAYKYQPPITPVEEQWLDRLSLPYPWRETAATTAKPKDDHLFEEIWAQPDLFDASVVPLPTVFNGEMADHSIGKLVAIAGQHQQAIAQLQQRPDLSPDLGLELANLATTAATIEHQLREVVLSETESLLDELTLDRDWDRQVN
jgi:two-component system, chemotaxis family, sensor histidine kinase and response regulator PixL